MQKTFVPIFISCLLGLAVILYNTGCKNKTRLHNALADTVVDTNTALGGRNITAGPDITDYDGNSYHTVVIGTQVWMADNLRVKHYNDGSPVEAVSADKQWRSLGTGAYCYYNNNKTDTTAYGLLYNWHAVNDARKLAPKGWHIPSQAEWQTLIDYAGGNDVAGSKFKAVSHWYDNTATSQAMFNALPSGDRNNNGTFNNRGYSATWWTSTTEPDVDFAINYSIISNKMSVNQDVDDRLCGLSIRCVKD